MLIFYQNQKKYVRHRHTRNHQSSKVITPAIFIPHILLPEIISGSYLCLYTYIFSWPHSNRAICIISSESARFTIVGYKQYLIHILSGLYEVSIQLVDSYSVVQTIDPRYRLITLFVFVEFTKKILFVPDFEYCSWKLTTFRVAI